MADAKNQKKVNEELKTTTSTLKTIREDVIGLDDAFVSLGNTINNELSGRLKKADKDTKDIAQTFLKDLDKSIKQSSKSLDEIDKISQKIARGQDASKEIAKERTNIENQRAIALRKIDVLERLGFKISAATVVKIEESYRLKLKQIDAQEELNEKQKDQVGIVAKLSTDISKFLDKIGLSKFEGFFQFEKSVEKANVKIERIQNITGKTLTDQQKQAVALREIKKNFDGTALAIGVLFKISKDVFAFALKIDQKVTDLSRNLGISKDAASDLKDELRSASMEAGFFGVTITDQIEAIDALNKGLGGVALTFDNETRVAAAETLKRLKLSEEAVGNLGMLAMATGKSFEELEDQQIASVIAAEKELGIRLNLKDVLEEANKITGLARVNISKFPGGLTKAVSVAKSLGVEMDAMASAAGQLLNFEESIQKELEAELLIGRDLNLEAARRAALSGNTEQLMRELVNQAGSLEKLQSMNVIQQEALAAALGLSADQLANQVLNGEALATQKDEQLARDEAAAEAQAKALSASEAQAVAMKKLADIFSFAVPILVGLAAAAAAMAVALTVGVGAPFISAGILKTAGAIGLGVGIAAGAATAVVGDATIPPGGPFAITDTSKPFGSTVLTTKGDGVAVSPNIRQEGAGGGMSETNRLLMAVLNKPTPKPTVNLDSIEIGTVAGLSAFPIQ